MRKAARVGSPCEVPRTGFEPARLAALPPQSSASASSATWASVQGHYTQGPAGVEWAAGGAVGDPASSTHVVRAEPVLPRPVLRERAGVRVIARTRCLG